MPQTMENFITALYISVGQHIFTFTPVVLQPQKWLIVDLKKWCDALRMLLSAGKKALEEN